MNAPDDPRQRDGETGPPVRDPWSAPLDDGVNDEPGISGTPAGPSFVFEPPGRHMSPEHLAGAADARSQALDAAGQYRPARSRLPTILTVAAVLVVAVVTAFSTALALREDAAVTTSPQPVPAATTAAATPSGDFIDFTSTLGAGRLRVLQHVWERSESGPATGHLRLEIQLSCSKGELEYGPYSFQAFDNRGDLYEVSDTNPSQPRLGEGALVRGQSVRGFLDFELPRGEVTLLMANDISGVVTALRIPD